MGGGLPLEKGDVGAGREKMRIWSGDMNRTERRSEEEYVPRHGGLDRATCDSNAICIDLCRGKTN